MRRNGIATKTGLIRSTVIRFDSQEIRVAIYYMA